MKKFSIPHDCLSCSYRPGEKDFDPVDCISCSSTIIEAYRSYVRELENYIYATLPVATVRETK